MDKGIGARLREAREEQGLDLDEVHERTKIRRRYLDALERERWELLPAPAYTRGFLRTYAAMLGLDAESLVALYRALEEPQTEPQPVQQLTDEHLELGIGTRALGRLGVGRGAKGAGRSGPAGRRRSPLPALAAVAVVALLVVAIVGIVAGADEDAADPPGPRGEAEEAPADLEPESGSEDADAEEQPAEPSPQRLEIELTATGEVWVCVVDHRGRAMVDGEILSAGDERGPFRARSFDAGLGNGQIEILADGEDVGVATSADPIGYRLTPERSRELDQGQRPTCA